MLMLNPFSDISRLFFPEVCAACGKPLPEGGEFLCTTCRWEIPLTGYWTLEKNPVAEKFYGLLPIVQACSFYFFVHESRFRNLIHKFKYQGGWKMAENTGRWFGSQLAGSELYGDIDVIIPVPLHLRKTLRRGYNQSEYIARGIASSMGKPVDTRNVVRKKHNRSQTSRPKSERWKNVEDIFAVRRPETLTGKHILLVDDVLTTGATIVSCGKAIVEAVPGCRLSIATLAVSKTELEKINPAAR